MFEQLDDTLFRILLPLPESPLKLLNVYCIRGEQRHLLIDTGFNRPECLCALHDAFQKMDVRTKDMDIFVTHLHADHSGLVSALATEGQTVFAGKDEAENIMQMTGGENYWRVFFSHLQPHGLTTEQIEVLLHTHPAVLYSDPKPVPMTYLVPGQLLHYGGRTLRVLNAAGHTPGQLCLYDAERKELFSADHVLNDITPNIGVWPGVRDSLGTYLENLRLMLELPMERAFPAHRSLIDAPHRRIEELITHHAHRLDEVREVLARAGEGGLTGFEVAACMHWSIRARSFDEFPVPQKWFAGGEALAHLDHLAVRGEVFSSKDSLGTVRFTAVSRKKT